MLSQRLGQHFGAIVVPEFVRDFAAQKGAPLDFADHGPIARGQMALEDEQMARAVATGNPLLIQDTDLLSTVVYCDHYFGRCPDWIREEASRRRPDLYLLMDIDVPWVLDDVRDRGHMREEMQALFRRAVEASGGPFATIGGNWEERLKGAIEAVSRLLQRTESPGRTRRP
jgi:nicotinamide riboside kinase